MSEKTDIEAPLREIVTRLGLDYADVASLDIQPGTVRATWFLRREDDKDRRVRYINETGGPAMCAQVFKVSQ